MTDQPEREGWTHELWERSRYEAAARWQRHGGKHDPTLARASGTRCGFTTNANIVFSV